MWRGKLPRSDISLRFAVTLSGIVFSGITTYCNCQRITLLFHLLRSSGCDGGSKLQTKTRVDGWTARIEAGAGREKRPTDEMGAESLINYLFVYCWAFPYRHRHCIYLSIAKSSPHSWGGRRQGGGGGVVFLKGCCVLWLDAPCKLKTMFVQWVWEKQRRRRGGKELKNKPKYLVQREVLHILRALIYFKRGKRLVFSVRFLSNNQKIH